MFKIKAQNKIINVLSGDNLMKTLLQNNIPVASSCNGEGVCCKCQLQIISGIENISPPTEIENSLLKQGIVDSGKRLSCQVSVFGDISVKAPYW